MSEIISRADAKSQGLKRYFTGKPCKHGHVDHRRVLDGKCLECDRGLSRGYVQNNREKKRASDKARYDRERAEILEKSKKAYSENPQKYLERVKAYANNYPDKVRENFKQWKQKNPDRKMATTKNWKTNNPEKRAEYQKTGRARKRLNKEFDYFISTQEPSE